MPVETRDMTTGQKGNTFMLMFSGSSALVPLAYLFPTSPFSLLIIGVIVLLLFGKRIPEVMRSLGSSVTEFKKGVKGIDEDDNKPSE